MKKLLSLLVLVLALSASAQVDTNTPPVVPDVSTNDPILPPEAQSLLSSWLSGALTASNWTAVAYGTYAPAISASQKVGGGLLAIYDVNQYVGAGLGLDYLGEFRMTSGNLKLQLPVKVGPLEFAPFALGGVGIALGGTSGSGPPALIGGGGVNVKVYSWAHGDVSVGYAATEWQMAGPYDGLHHSFFAGVKFRF